MRQFKQKSLYCPAQVVVLWRGWSHIQGALPIVYKIQIMEQINPE
jgi:hypothetical protein